MPFELGIPLDDEIKEYKLGTPLDTSKRAVYFFEIDADWRDGRMGIIFPYNWFMSNFLADLGILLVYPELFNEKRLDSLLHDSYTNYMSKLILKEFEPKEGAV